MAESSSHNPYSPKITPKEEQVTLDKPESPNPFLLADQVEATDGSNHLCLGEKTGVLDQISNKDATILYCLANRVKVDYAKLIWEDIIHKLNKKIREKFVSYPRKKSSKYTSESKTEASKSKTGQSEKETQSCSGKYNSPNNLSPLTLVFGEMRKEAHQAAGGLKSLRATGEEGAHPQLSSGHDASVDSTTKAGPRNSAPNDSIPKQQGKNKESKADEILTKIKLEDLSDLLKDTRSVFFTPDSPQDEHIIVSDESEEEGDKKDKTDATSHDLKKHVQDMEIELPVDLKETPIKLETFTSTISNLLSQVAELENIQWELLAEFQALQSHVSPVQKKLKTLDSLSSLLNKVTNTLTRFATMMENASGAACNNVLLAGQASASPAEGEKNTTKDAETSLQNELVDLLGIDMVEQYHNKKLLFDKYYDKMLKRRKSSKIINCDVLAQKGVISLKVYREDGTIKVIANFKVSDLHLTEEKKKDRKLSIG
nr:hypothetical protein [Tanacetum cinerariifolium]